MTMSNEKQDLWEICSLPNGAVLELRAGDEPALVLVQGKNQVKVELAHVKGLVAALVEAAADLAEVLAGRRQIVQGVTAGGAERLLGTRRGIAASQLDDAAGCDGQDRDRSSADCRRCIAPLPASAVGVPKGALVRESC